MHSRHIDLGLLTLLEMAMTATQKQTSFSFPIIITKLCKYSSVPLHTARDIENTRSSSNDIRHIVVEYTCEEADRRKSVSADTSPEIDVDLFNTDASAPILDSGHQVQ